MFNYLQPCELHHARLLCPSLSPWICSNACPLSQWCYPTTRSSVAPLSFCLAIFPSIKVFSSESALSIRWPKYWNFSFSISPSNEFQDWFPLELTALISLLSKELSRVFSNTTFREHQFFGVQPSLWSNSNIHTWLLEKLKLWLDRPLLAKWCLCFLICYLGLS